MSDNQPQQPAENNGQPAARETPAATPQGGQVPGADKKVLAGILGILLGAFGVHKFILGYKNEGIIMAAIAGGALVLGIPLSFFGIGCLILPLVWVVGIVGLIEGIIYLTKSDEEFVNTYITNKKPWF